MRFRLLAVGALVVSACAVVVAPGLAQDKASMGTLRVYAPDAEGLKGAPVQVGQIDSLTGASAPQLQGQVSVLVAAARAVNRSGGVHGRPLAVAICDDHTDSAGAADCARQMVSKGVVAVLGGESINDSQVQPILEAAKIPQIGILAISAAQSNGSNVFLFNPPNAYLAAGMSAYAYFHGDKPVANVINDTGTAGRAFEASILPLIEPFMPEGFKPEVFIAPTVGDFSPAASSIAAAGTKGVVMSIVVARGLQIDRAIQQLAPNVQHFYYPGAMSLQAGTQGLGTSIDKVIQAQVTPPFTDPKMKEFTRAMAQQEKRGDKNVDLNRLAPRDVYPYVALKALVAATKGMTTISAANVLSKLNTVKDLNIGPFFPPWTPSTPGPQGSPRASNTSMWFVGYKNAKAYLLVPHAVSYANFSKGKF